MPAEYTRKKYLLHTNISRNDLYLKCSDGLPELSWRQGHSDMEGPYVSASDISSDFSSGIKIKIYFSEDEKHEVYVRGDERSSDALLGKAPEVLGAIGSLEEV